MKKKLKNILLTGTALATLGIGFCAYLNTRPEEFCETYQGHYGPRSFRTFSGEDRRLIFYVFDPVDLRHRQGDPRIIVASEQGLGLNRGSRYCFKVNRPFLNFDVIDETSIRPQ